ncbi:MAG: arginine repressor [Clostridia bacterium]|nr:arginine repressor [Clostridia bacterium]
MKKNVRHEKILSLIQEFDISTQEQLMLKLTEAGFDVTQATVSRDIKAMNLVKIQGSNGQYKYSAVRKDNEHGEKFDAILAHAVISVDYAMNITCVHCYSGMANAACAAIDAIHFDKSIGTIAGDDTIFILNRTEDAAKELMNTIRSVIR